MTREEMRRLINKQIAREGITMKSVFRRWKGIAWLDDKIYRSLSRGEDTVSVLCDENRLQCFKAFRGYIKARCNEKGIRHFTLLMYNSQIQNVSLF